MHEGQVDSSSPPYDDVQPNQSPTYYSWQGGPSKSKLSLLDYLEENWHYSPNKKSI